MNTLHTHFSPWRKRLAGTALAGLVGACDGELTVGQIIGAIASLFEVDEQSLTSELMADVRGMIVDGLLIPVGAQTH